jgi:hypothetical protein
MDDIFANLPRPKENDARLFFPTPPDAIWENVSIRFRDGHTVSIKVKSVGGVFNYTQMGMANKKNGNPTIQWKLFEAFANSKGEIDWKNSHAHPNLKKQKQELANCLKEFFQLENDPIEWDKVLRPTDVVFASSLRVTTPLILSPSAVKQLHQRLQRNFVGLQKKNQKYFSLHNLSICLKSHCFPDEHSLFVGPSHPSHRNFDNEGCRSGENLIPEINARVIRVYAPWEIHSPDPTPRGYFLMRHGREIASV